MKFWLSRLALVALILYGVFTAVCAVTPFGHESGGKWFAPPCDFSLRMTELECLKRGVNPFDVWHGEVILPPFRPNIGSKVSGPEFTEDINAYAPWEYAFMLPLSYLPRSLAWGLYFFAMMGALAFLFAVGYRFGRTRFGNTVDATLVGVLPVLLIAYPAWSNACIGNFSIIVLAATVAMALALSRGHDVLAGVFWAVAMLKPQIGVLFAVPLLMRRKWRMCAVAVGVCLLASVLPSWMCRTSPLTLILQTPAANAFMFHGSGTWPYLFCGFFGETTNIFVALIIGLGLCVLLTRALPKNCDWLVYLSPAAICSMSWTYVSTYGHVMAWFFFLWLMISLLENPRSCFLWTIAALSLLVVTRVYNCYRGAVSAFAGYFPGLAYPENIHWQLDSLNSFLDLLLFVVFVVCFVWKKGRSYGSKS